MFCSTIIPTIGRPALQKAVQSVLDQQFTADAFEVIVVNDSGTPLPPAEWQNSPRVRIINTQQHERCIARNAGAAIALGKYLHFLDDDDWLLPGAWQTFWELDQKTEAIWLYGSAELVDREGEPIIDLRHSLQGNCLTQLIAGEWLPLQASLIQAQAFFAVGGFHPLIPGTEDIHLGREIAMRGDVAGTTAVTASIGMGEENSTTNYARSLLFSRWAREKILSQAGAWTRMRQSANSGYWHGRIVRAYYTSFVWNWERHRFWTAVSRATTGTGTLLLCAPYFAQKEFWQAISHRHESPTFLRGFLEANKPVVRR